MKGKRDALTEVFSDKQRRVAELLSKAVSIPDACEQVGVHQRTVRGWLKNPDYAALVDVMTARNPARPLPDIFRKKFGVPSMSDVRDLLVSQLMFASLLDPADVMDKDGRLRPLGEMPPEVRMCVQEINLKKGTIKFVDKLGAIREVFNAVGLRDPRQHNAKLDDITMDFSAMLGDREGDTERRALDPGTDEQIKSTMEGYNDPAERAAKRDARDE